MSDATNATVDKVVTQLRASLLHSPKTTILGVLFAAAIYFGAHHFSIDQMDDVLALAVLLIGAISKDGTASGKA